MERASWRRIAVLLLVAFAIRLAAGWVWQSRLDGKFGMGDTESYWTLGKAIAEGQPYEYGENHARVFRTPGYPVLLAPIFWLTADKPTATMLARAEAALFGTLAVLGVWGLTRLLFDDRAALLAAVFASFYPGAIVLGVLILSEAPFCPLLLLQLVLWDLAWKAPATGKRTLWGFAAGLAAGAATLMRPSWLLFTPFAVTVGMIAALFTRSSDARTFPRHCRIGLAMLLGLSVAMLPWWIRNACVTGHFIPTTLQVGASLYDGLNPHATGASNMDFVQSFETEERQALQHSPESSRSSLEMRLDRRMRDDAIAWARANPGRSLQLAGVKFLRMWNVWPNDPSLAGNWFARWAVFFAYTPLLILAIMGALRTVGRGWPYLLCCLPAVYLTALHVVFVSSIRYRDPALLALLALAAGAGLWRRKDCSTKERRASVQ
jgi:4-amino-4-deoxy-L-arabinose transferase-like glycosyltransferase